MLTRAQAVMLDAHFGVEQSVRFATGMILPFNGTCGVWRRDAIDDAGGWTADTLTEDLDLAIRAQLAGWRAAYLPQVTAAGELPTDAGARGGPSSTAGTRASPRSRASCCRRSGARTCRRCSSWR